VCGDLELGWLVAPGYVLPFDPPEGPLLEADQPSLVDTLTRTVNNSGVAFAADFQWPATARIIGETCGNPVKWRYEFVDANGDTPLQLVNVPLINAGGVSLFIGMFSGETPSFGGGEPPAIDVGTWSFFAEVCGRELGPIDFVIIEDGGGGDGDGC